MRYRRHAAEAGATFGALCASVLIVLFGLAAGGTPPLSALLLAAAGISAAITVASRRAWPLAIAALDFAAAVPADLAAPTDKVFDMAAGYAGVLLAFGLVLVATAGMVRSFGLGRYATPLESVGVPLAVVAAAPLLAEHRVNGDIPETGLGAPATVLVLAAGAVVSVALVHAIRHRGPLRLPLAALAAAGLALALAPLALRYSYAHPLRVAWTFRTAVGGVVLAALWLGLAGRRAEANLIRRSTAVLAVAALQVVGAVAVAHREDRREHAIQLVRFQVAPIPPAALRGPYLPLTYVDQTVEARGRTATVGDEVEIVLERSGRFLWEPTHVAGIEDAAAVRLRAIVTAAGDPLTVRFPDIDRAPLPTRPAAGVPPPVAVIAVAGNATARIVHLEVARRPGRGWPQPQSAATGTAASAKPSYPAAATVSQAPR